MLTIPSEIIFAANAARAFNKNMTTILDQATVASEADDDSQIQESLDKFNKDLDKHLAALAATVGGYDNLELIIGHLASK